MEQITTLLRLALLYLSGLYFMAQIGPGWGTFALCAQIAGVIAGLWMSTRRTPVIRLFDDDRNDRSGPHSAGPAQHETIQDHAHEEDLVAV